MRLALRVQRELARLASLFHIPGPPSHPPLPPTDTHTDTHTRAQVLSTRRCEQCGTETYEANLTCHQCKAVLEPCSVSGYPTASYDKVVSTQNGYDVVAIRDHWNLWATTFSACPVTGGAAAPMY